MLAMAIQVVDNMSPIEQSYEGLPSPIPPLVLPHNSTIDNVYGTTDEFSVYSWDERAPLNKAHCLDCGDLITPREIKDSLGIDTGIVPMFWGDMIMRDHIVINGIYLGRDS